jgi:hypothetical protein
MARHFGPSSIGFGIHVEEHVKCSLSQWCESILICKIGSNSIVLG